MSTEKEKRVFIAPLLAPLPGHVWNPLLKLPPNQKCPCLSGQKFKRCCRPKLPRAVLKKVAEQYKEQMKLPDLVFVNDSNAETVVDIARKAETL